MIVSLLLAVFTVWVIASRTKSYSLPDMVRALKHCNMVWMVAAIASMFCFILFEGMSLECLIKGLTNTKKNHDGVLYSAADIYFSAITPSATGGQPASAFFMIQDGIPAAQATVILLINLIMYTLSLLVIGLFCCILRPRLLFGFNLVSMIFIVIGYVVLICLTLTVMLMLRKEKWIRKLATLLISVGSKLHLVRNKEKKLEKLEHLLEQYKECSTIVQGKSKLLRKVFAFNLLQRIAQISTTMFVYLALHGKLWHAFNVWSIQAMVSVGSYCAPVPGAVGVADYLLLNGLKMIPKVPSVANLELLSRGISFYACVLISVIIVIGGNIRNNIKSKGSK